MQQHTEGLGKLSATEATLVATLLGAGLETEGDRIQRSGLPRSTFQDAKRRLYERGVVEDRYVPDPLVFGTRYASAVICRPYADEWTGLVESWRNDPRAAVVWKGLHTAFGLVFHSSPDPGAPWSASAKGSDESPRAVLSVDLTALTVPIYFDFEGAWGNLAGATTLWQYPRPLVLRPTDEVGLASAGSRKMAIELLDRTGAGPSSLPTSRPPHLMAPQALPRSSRRMFERGWIQWRTFPSPRHLSTSDGRGVDSIVWVLGTLREEREPPALFRELVVRRSFPFLMMTNGQRVLLGFLSSATPVPAVGETGAGAVLTQHLVRIETYREPVRDLVEVVDHRYAGVLGAEDPPRSR